MAPSRVVAEGRGSTARALSLFSDDTHEPTMLLARRNSRGHCPVTHHGAL